MWLSDFLFQFFHQVVSSSTSQSSSLPPPSSPKLRCQYVSTNCQIYSFLSRNTLKRINVYTYACLLFWEQKICQYMGTFKKTGRIMENISLHFLDIVKNRWHFHYHLCLNFSLSLHVFYVFRDFLLFYFNFFWSKKGRSKSHTFVSGKYFCHIHLKH